jgi:hypothetical protein
MLAMACCASRMAFSMRPLSDFIVNWCSHKPGLNFCALAKGLANMAHKAASKGRGCMGLKSFISHRS